MPISGRKRKAVPARAASVVSPAEAATAIAADAVKGNMTKTKPRKRVNTGRAKKKTPASPSSSSSSSSSSTVPVPPVPVVEDHDSGSSASPASVNAGTLVDALDMSQSEVEEAKFGGFHYHDKKQYPAFDNPNEELMKSPRYFRNVDPTDFTFFAKPWTMRGSSREHYFIKVMDCNGNAATVIGPFALVKYAMMWPLGDWTGTNPGAMFTEDDLTKANYTFNYRSSPAWDAAMEDKDTKQDPEVKAFMEWIKVYEDWFYEKVWDTPQLFNQFKATIKASFIKQKKAQMGITGGVVKMKWGEVKQHWLENFCQRKVRCDKTPKEKVSSALMGASSASDNKDDDEEDIVMDAGHDASIIPHTDQLYANGKVFKRLTGKAMDYALSHGTAENWHPQQKRLLKKQVTDRGTCIHVYNRVKLFTAADDSTPVPSSQARLSKGDVVSPTFVLSGYAWMPAHKKTGATVSVANLVWYGNRIHRLTSALTVPEPPKGRVFKGAQQYHAAPRPVMPETISPAMEEAMVAASQRLEQAVDGEFTAPVVHKKLLQSPKKPTVADALLATSSSQAASGGGGEEEDDEDEVMADASDVLVS